MAGPAGVADHVRGLTSAEAAQRLDADGPNVLPQRKREPPWRQLAAQLTHMLALLLWVGSVLALIAGMPALAAAIAVIVVINAVFAFWQEYRADRSADRLRSLIPTRATVLRDGSWDTCDVVDLVRDDVVRLEAGDKVGADLRVLAGEHLHTDESLVTGESVPVAHVAGDQLVTGSFVVQGEATAVVEQTGSRTTLAGISALAESAERPPSPLVLELDRVVRVVAVIAISTGTLLGVGSVLLGLDLVDAFLFGIGVTVALVPEGLLPTVTLSLARGAQQMADEQALVRRLDSVETLGATTIVCTDKTGTITQNRMQVVEVATADGPVTVDGEGYDPAATLTGSPDACRRTTAAAAAAAACVTGRVVQLPEAPTVWTAEGDPMEAALDCLARRCGVTDHGDRVVSRQPYSPERLCSAAVVDGRVHVLGAPEAVFAAAVHVDPGLQTSLATLTERGLRVLAVASGEASWDPEQPWEIPDHGLELLGLLALEDPPRSGVREALLACRDADIRVVMLTGDHPRTARAIAREVGLLGPAGSVLVGRGLPADDAVLGEMLDHPHGAVVARVTPADKFRIAKVLRERGHVVAMTGDGVNDAPALREADVGVAMGATGSDVAREAADVVLLDDHFATIVSAVRLGRATFQNVRRFLTYHLTDNVAELTPFALWALTAGHYPLAISVLQVLALDIGTDMLPAIGLGAEPPGRHVMEGRRHDSLVDRSLLVRAFLVLGATEAVLSMTAFTIVLRQGGWQWGETPGTTLAAVASGSAFAVIACCQVANAFACRSTTRPVWAMPPFTNRLLLGAVVAELVLLVVFLGFPPVSDLLGGSWPTAVGWTAAVASAAVLLMVDATAKAWHHRAREAAR